MNSDWVFPGGPWVKNLPSNARDTGSIPGQGTKIPHTSGQLNPSATARDARVLQQRHSAVKKKKTKKQQKIMNSDHILSLSKLTNAIPCGSEGSQGPCHSPKDLHGVASATFSSSSPSTVLGLNPLQPHQPPDYPSNTWSTFPLQSSHSRHSFCLKNTFLGSSKDMDSFFLLLPFAFLHICYCKFTWYPVAPYYCRQWWFMKLMWTVNKQTLSHLLLEVT